MCKKNIILQLTNDRKAILYERYSIIEGIEIVPNDINFNFFKYCKSLNLIEPFIGVQGENDYNSIKYTLLEYINLEIKKRILTVVNEIVEYTSVKINVFFEFVFSSTLKSKNQIAYNIICIEKGSIVYINLILGENKIIDASEAVSFFIDAYHKINIVKLTIVNNNKKTYYSLIENINDLIKVISEQLNKKNSF